ncbi:hypothetical protein FB451DRAFT_1410886 [Mycena latifolia]|nr:hypothetical protein FB451DRAFT_1410886 [Mycena latifolia]
MLPSRSPNALHGYSSFLLSGLSPPSSSSSSLRSHDSDFDLGPRRGSLPTDCPPSYNSSGDDVSMFYFTLQPKRDTEELRSFLSLDLAESQSLRSRSMKRKPSTRHSREPPFAVDFQIPDSPSLLPPRSPMSLRRSPATSPRALPSPKPAPVSTLPNVPSQPSTPRSPGLQVAVSRTPTPVAIQPVPPQRKPSLASQVTRASATTSTVSTRYRRKRRNKALACLEGRRPAPARASPSDNFMSLSDDEDEEDDTAVLRSASPEELLDLSLSDDQLIVLIAGLDDGDVHSAPVSSAHFKQSSRESTTRSASTNSTHPRRRKASLVLKSFMDFHNEEDSSRWSWRSFIEVAT